jgi:site-specific DNA-methyltransferase (adenine-specific)
MKPYYQDDAVTIYHGDAMKVMQDMPDNSVDLIATDPPYFRVKNEPWDRAWDSRKEFLAWIGELCEQWRRILKPNGSLYVFASPYMRAHVEIKISTYFHCLPTITWSKSAGYHKSCSKESLRSFFPASEAIIFAEHYGSDNIAKGEAGYVAKCDELRGFVFEPLRAYFDSERVRCGISNQQIMDGMAARGVGRYMFARHTFSRSQWQLPTREQYEAARDLFNTFANGGDYLRREYEDLRREYEELRREYEDLRRPFRVTADVPYTDVWTFPTVGAYKGKHPCEKPIDMMEHIVRASTRPGAVVLDCFGGSGTTAHAAVRLGRKAVVIEEDEKWCRKSTERITHQVAPLYPVEPDTEQLAGRDGSTDSGAKPLFSAEDTKPGETPK